MRIDEILQSQDDLDEWQASKELCRSSRPNSKLGQVLLQVAEVKGFELVAVKSHTRLARNVLQLAVRKSRARAMAAHYRIIADEIK